MCLEQSASARRIFEKWEFEKDYKYSVLFTTPKNENYILPIIGELKEILNDHRNDLDKCPALKEQKKKKDVP